MHTTTTMIHAVSRTALRAPLLLALLSPLQMAAAATPATPVKAAMPAPLPAAHVEAVRQMLSVVKGETLLQAAVKDNAALRPSQQALFKHLFATTTPQRQQELILRALARHLTLEEARSIAEAYATAPGQRALALPAGATQSDDVAAFNALPPALLLAGAVKAARPAIEQAANEWGADALHKLTDTAVAVARLTIGDINRRDEYSAPVSIQYWSTRTGVAAADELALALVVCALKTDHANREFLLTAKEMAWGEMLWPANLASPEKVASSLRRLDLVEVAAGRYLTEQRAGFQQANDSFDKIDMPFDTGHVADAAKSLLPIVAIVDRFAKAHNAIIPAQRAILTFAAERPGQFSVKNDKLVIASKADERTFAALNKKLVAARALQSAR